jgi:hypothetical protein
MTSLPPKLAIPDCDFRSRRNDIEGGWIRTILRYGESREVKGKKREIQHLPAMPAKDVPEFMREPAVLDGPDARALAFTIHTAPRSGMTLRATWSEITDVD